MVLVQRRNPGKLRRGDQRALKQHKIENESSKDKLFFINHIAVGSTQAKWYLVQVDMDQSDPVDTTNHGVYCYRWYIIQYDNCNKYPTVECQFWIEIRMNNQDSKLVDMFLVRPSKVHNLLQKNKTYLWYQDYISLYKHKVFGTIEFGTAGRKKLKYPNMINDKQWK